MTSGDDSTSSIPPKRSVTAIAQSPLFTITVNVCKSDPENADYWSNTKINLFDTPGGRISGTLPPCSSIKADVLETKTVNNVEFYKVRIESTVGWQTKRLLVG